MLTAWLVPLQTADGSPTSFRGDDQATLEQHLMQALRANTVVHGYVVADGSGKVVARWALGDDRFRALPGSNSWVTNSEPL